MQIYIKSLISQGNFKLKNEEICEKSWFVSSDFLNYLTIQLPNVLTINYLR